MQQFTILLGQESKGDYYRYAQPMASVSDAGNFDGNIAYQHWRTQTSDNSYSTHQAWKYTYDERNYLSLANFGLFNFDVAIQRNSFVKSTTNNYAVYGAYDSGATPAVMPMSGEESFTGIAYDANGNLLNLNRNGENGELLDQFLYDYVTGTNRLNFIRDGAGEVIPGLDYKGSNTKAYDYNAIGQLTENIVDGHYFTYDVYGKTQQIYTDAAHTSLLADYIYDDRGFRVKKFDNQTQATTWYVRDASGNMISTYTKENTAALQRTEVPVYGSGRLGMATCNTTGGINSYTYELSDHLGNVRATLGKSVANNTTQLLTATDYYPFGMTMPGRNYRLENYRFGYQGQFAEKDQETGYNQFELRLYDARIIRWHCPDPYNQYWSSYVAMGNNPVARIDSDGGFDGEWTVDVETGTRTKVSNMGDDIGMDFVHYTRTHSDGAIESLGSFTAATGSWGGKLISRSSPLNYAAKEALFNGHIRNEMNKSGYFIFESAITIATYTLPLIRIASMPAKMIAMNALTNRAADMATAKMTAEFLLVTAPAVMKNFGLLSEYETLPTMVIGEYNPKLAKRIDFVVNVHGGVKGAKTMNGAVQSGLSIGKSISGF